MHIDLTSNRPAQFNSHKNLPITTDQETDQETDISSARPQKSHKNPEPNAANNPSCLCFFLFRVYCQSVI